jgi:hypothetical protein
MNEFHYPVSYEALRESSSSFLMKANNPINIEALDAETVYSTLQDIQSRLEENCESLYTEDSTFETLFSYLPAITNNIIFDNKNKKCITTMILDSLDSLTNSLPGILEEHNPEHCKIARNSLKMLLFLLTQLLTQLEKQSTANNSSTIDLNVDQTENFKPKRGGKAAKSSAKAAKSNNSDGEFNWELHKERAIVILGDLMSSGAQAVSGLFSMGQIDENLGISLFESALVIYENNNNKANKTLLSAAQKLFVGVCKKFAVGQRIVSNILSILTTNEASISLLAELIAQTLEITKNSQLLHEFLVEICNFDSNSALKNDNSACKNSGLFLSELSSRAPKQFLRFLSCVEQFFHCENYLLRNSALQILANIVEKGFERDSTHVEEAEKEEKRAKKGPESIKKALKGKNSEDSDEEISDISDLEEEIGTESSGMSEKSSELAESRDKEGLTGAQFLCREKVFALLESRITDINAFTRSKLLQALIGLVSARKLPAHRFSSVISLAKQRLYDKTSAVRRFSVELLCNVLIFNPFGPNLALENWQNSAEQAGIRLKNNILAKANTSGGDESVKQQIMTENSQNSQLLAEKLALDELMAIIKAIEELNGAVPVILLYFSSKTNTDILCAVEFFVAATEFQLLGAISGVKLMMNGVWSREISVRDAVISAYQRLYIGREIYDLQGPQQKKLSIQIAQNLMNLVENATLAELTSLQQLISRLILQEQLPGVVISTLLDIFLAKTGVEPAERQAALIIITMAAEQNPENLANSLGNLVNAGLNSKNNHFLQRTACVALQKALQTSEIRAKTPSEFFDLIYSRLCGIILDDCVRPDSENWYTAAEQAISTLFLLHSSPHLVAETLLKQLTFAAFHSSPAPSSANSLGNAERLSRLFFLVGHVAIKILVKLEAQEAAIKKLRQNKSNGREKKEEKPEESDDSEDNSDSEIVEDEFGVEKRVKRAKAAKPKRKPKKSGQELSSKSPQKTSSIEEELAVNASEEWELEQQRENAEKHLVMNKAAADGAESSLLSVYAELILMVVRAPGKYNHGALQNSAVLALCKLMCVNPVFCEANLQLLFTILKQSQDSHIKSNIIICLGDLAFRFPNLIEPWSEHIYGGLRESNEFVKFNTLQVLTHLILNDMLKAKGPIAELTKCIIDNNPRINNLAKLFFTELSSKSKNPIYNILPDIIGRLSADKTVSSDQFKAIFKFLIGFINKEKQTESLVEKFCHRFDNVYVEAVAPQLLDSNFAQTSDNSGDWLKISCGLIQPGADNTTLRLDIQVLSFDSDFLERKLNDNSENNERNLTPEELELKQRRAQNCLQLKQCRDISYCLTQLNYSLASTKKLLHCFRCYQGKLGDETVHSQFLAILAKANKLAKPELKLITAELEQKINEMHEKLVEEARVNSKANNIRIMGNSRLDLQENARMMLAEEDAEALDEQKQREVAAQAAKKPAKGRKLAGKNKGKAAPAKAKAKGKPRKRVVESDEEEDMEISEEEED